MWKQEQIDVSAIVEVGGDDCRRRRERIPGAYFRGVSNVGETAITIVPKKDIRRAGYENIKVTIVVDVHKRRGKVWRAFQHRHIKASLLSTIRKMSVTVVVIKHKPTISEAQDKQICPAVVIVITRNGSKTILTVRE